MFFSSVCGVMRKLCICDCRRLCITGGFCGSLATSLCITLCVMWIDMRICIFESAYTDDCIYSMATRRISEIVYGWGKRTEIYRFFCEYDSTEVGLDAIFCFIGPTFLCTVRGKSFWKSAADLQSCFLTGWAYCWPSVCLLWR